MGSSGWISLEGLDVWETRRGTDYVLILSQDKMKPDKELTPEDAYILGDALKVWAVKMKEKGWEDTIVIVFDGKKKYIRKREEKEEKE